MKTLLLASFCLVAVSLSAQPSHGPYPQPGGGGTGSGFPLTSNVSGGGFSITNLGGLQVVGGVPSGITVTNTLGANGSNARIDTNGVITTTSYESNGNWFFTDWRQTNYLAVMPSANMFSNALGVVEVLGDSLKSSNRLTGKFTLSTNGVFSAGSGAVGMGATGLTNTAAAQFTYANLQYSTNCGWGGVQSNGVANSTLTLAGFEEFVASMGNTIVQLGDATTNLGHHIAITCGSSGTNAITTVASQKIAGMTKWTNTVIYSCTQLISDGANWQICGSRGN